MRIRIISIVIFLMLPLCSCAIALGSEKGVADLTAAGAEGVKMLNDFSGAPDDQGVMKTLTFKLPPFEKCVYYRSMWWPAGGNRVRPFVYDSFSDADEGGIFAIIKLKDGDHLAILPIGSEKAYSWFDSDGENLLLKFGTHGTESIEGDFPLYTWSRSKDLYKACYDVWKKALNLKQTRGFARMRDEKKYPEVFRYLGWCSWEQYRGKISEENMTRAMRDIESSGIPIRFFLIDNGHFDGKTLRPNSKFPNGYKAMTDLCKDDGIKWFVTWHAYMGTKFGMRQPDIGNVIEHMMKTPSGAVQPKPTYSDAEAFFEYLYSYAKRDGANAVKVDFSTYALPYYAGLTTQDGKSWKPEDNSRAIGNPYAAAVQLFRAFEDVTDKQMEGLINCNYMITSNLFNMDKSVVGRCSEDYKVGNLSRAKGHTYHSYAAMPWLGQLAFGDHDMFHSNDKFAGRLMAVSKAMSAAPVYLSDDPKHFNADAIYPLCYQDGLLLRPMAPGTPLGEDIFYEPDTGKLLRVIAPLANKTAAIAVYNLDGGTGENEKSLATTITPNDYAAASALIQPYPGLWPIPPEGIVIYDWYNGKAAKLEKEYDVAIAGFGDRLLQLSPIQHGFSVIGRADKYLSAAAVEVISAKAGELKIKMIESGPLLIWAEHGKPKAKNIEFVHLGNALYKAEMPVGEKNKVIVISAK